MPLSTKGMPPGVWDNFQIALQSQLRRGESTHFVTAVEAVCRGGGTLLAMRELLSGVQRQFNEALLPQFSISLEHCSTLADDDFAAAFPAALAQLCSPLESYRLLLVATTQHIMQAVDVAQTQQRAKLLTFELQLQHTVAASLLVATDKVLPGQLRRFFNIKLVEMSTVAAAEGMEDEGRVSHDMDEGPDAGPATGAAGLQDVASCMHSVELDDVLEQAAAEAASEHVERYIAGRAVRTFDESVLGPALEYSSTVPLAFLQLVLSRPQTAAAALGRWRKQLTHMVYQSVGCLRIQEMFDIVVDYPDSEPALADLHECMRHTNLHRKLVTRFGQAIRDRLLHPGAATADIIQQYVSTIRALQHVDPSGAVLDAVSGPIREYLRTRKDTTRCIVTLLTDDSANGAMATLFVELGGGGGGGDADALFDGPDADEQALLEAERWEPDPIEADPVLRTTTGNDAISLLVGVYGSKELFVSEYRSMLADRLLAKSDYDCDRELRTLELLKVRFGETSLHAAEVMLRDLAESKRVNANVKSVPNTATPLKKRQDLVPVDALSATVISQLFWPQLPEEDFVLPGQVRAMLETYAHKYNSLKAPRILEWKPNLGTVSLDLTIGDRQLEFNVSPFHATVLLNFQTKPEWNQTELAQALGAPPDVLRRKIVFWVNNGVLAEQRSADGTISYRRNEQLQSGGAGVADESGMDMEEGGGADQEQLEMAKLEPFILGMLTNFDSLPLDRIHNMLKMFATDPPYDKTLDQLSAYMGRLATEDKLVLEGGVYKRRS